MESPAFPTQDDALIADLGREVISLRHHIKEIPRHQKARGERILGGEFCLTCSLDWPCPVEKAHQAVNPS